MTRLAKDILYNVLSEVIDQSICQEKLEEMDSNYEEYGEHSVEEAEKYINYLIDNEYPTA